MSTHLLNKPTKKCVNKDCFFVTKYKLQNQREMHSQSRWDWGTESLFPQKIDTAMDETLQSHIPYPPQIPFHASENMKCKG